MLTEDSTQINQEQVSEVVEAAPQTFPKTITLTTREGGEYQMTVKLWEKGDARRLYITGVGFNPVKIEYDLVAQAFAPKSNYWFSPQIAQKLNLPENYK